jgi:hypothetical protein
MVVTVRLRLVYSSGPLPNLQANASFSNATTGGGVTPLCSNSSSGTTSTTELCSGVTNATAATAPGAVGLRLRLQTVLNTGSGATEYEVRSTHLLHVATMLSLSVRCSAISCFMHMGHVGADTRFHLVVRCAVQASLPGLGAAV